MKAEETKIPTMGRIVFYRSWASRSGDGIVEHADNRPAIVIDSAGDHLCLMVFSPPHMTYRYGVPPATDNAAGWLWPPHA